MRGKWHIVLFVGALGSGALGGYCHVRSQGLAVLAEDEQKRSVTSQSSFVDTLSGQYVDSQLGQMDRRRELIASSSRWNEAMLFALVGVVFLAFAGYTVRSVETAFEEGSHIGPMPDPAPQRP
ncbi:MAG: hypothetical protein JST54_19050 [Deltaproteobacteria bacterium]|nr:hypothetical protein [Deltaproteobacteria bacterium]